MRRPPEQLYHDRQEVIYLLLDRGPLTLDELVSYSTQSYPDTWSILGVMRTKGLVLPSYKNSHGRVSGGPQKYFLNPDTVLDLTHLTTGLLPRYVRAQDQLRAILAIQSRQTPDAKNSLIQAVRKFTRIYNHEQFLFQTARR